MVNIIFKRKRQLYSSRLKKKLKEDRKRLIFCNAFWRRGKEIPGLLKIFFVSILSTLLTLPR